MSAEYSGLQGACIAAGRLTGSGDPSSITLGPPRFQCSDPVRLGTGHYTVQLAQSCDPDRRAVLATGRQEFGASLTVIEDSTLADDTTVAFFLTDQDQPVEGSIAFAVIRTEL